MKRIFSSCLVCLCAIALCDVTSAATGRVGVYSNPTSRMPTMAVQTVGVTTAVSNIKETPLVPEVKPDNTPDEEPVIDMREKERLACLSNNIGVGNTFVWASRYSDINNYSTMVEDVEHPENNTCFVFVDLKSSDPKIDLSGFWGKYFEMGRDITCGSWVDENDIEKRILDAKKKNRTLATIGGAVGGAAVGVGAMELFGNRLIDKAVTPGDKGGVQGQKSVKWGEDGVELAQSQLLTMCNKNFDKYKIVMDRIEKIDKACEAVGESKEECNEQKISAYRKAYKNLSQDECKMQN